MVHSAAGETRALAYLVMEVVSDWMLRLSRNEEVSRNHPGSCGEIRSDGPDRPPRQRRGQGVTLVDELVEGVLAVGPWLAPHDRARVVLDTDAIFADVLPVGLHVALTTAEKTRLLAVGPRSHVKPRGP